ncbi:FtsK/SpoIIIE domain-containing protein [Cellulomonas soli]|uniref:FtsK/SpoIIIE domain-containing protein n=1 Tax=Cellulomonas soli TaxID=931535 RepID=UPI003F826838
MLLTVVHPDLARGPGLHPTDVDVDEGIALPALLAHLARLTGWAGWPRTSVAVGPTTLTTGHATGHYPLVAGCTLRPGPTEHDELGGAAAGASRAAWHLAVVSGPDCGALHGLEPGAAPLRVGAGRDRVDASASSGTGEGTDPHVEVRVRDPRWGDLVVQVRTTVRRGRTRFHVRLSGRTPDGPGVARLVRDPRLHRGRGRARRPVRAPHLALHHPWRRWRPTETLQVGTTRLALRPAPDATAPDVLATAGADGVRRGGAGRTEALGMLAPAIGSIALAAALRQPLLLLTALVGPATLLASRTSRTSGTPGPGSPGRGGASQGTDTTRPAPADPAALAAVTVQALWSAGSPTSAQTPAMAGRHASTPARTGMLDQPGATLAVVGPPQEVRAAARALVLGAVGPHADRAVQVRCGAGLDWAWTRWLPGGAGTLPGRDDPPTVVVADLTGPAGSALDEMAALARWRAQVPSPHQLLLLVADETGRGGPRVPGWCRQVLHVRAGRARLRTPDGRSSEVPLHAVTVAWADAQARRVAAVVHTRPGASSAGTPGAGDGRGASDAHAGRTGRGVPTTADLGALPGMPPAQSAQVAAAWGRDGTMTAALGLGEGGLPVHVDLVRDGPHLLVAGTTGSGKSQLLSDLVLSLALTNPPDRLAVALVDFKGGTSLGAVADLPHVVGQVSDLDAAHASRALAGLRAELHRRERLVAAAGARDLAELDPLDPTTPARLLVVVDEFRALADELPDALPALGRLAAQGRSLGMHLVLATQRPAGAVTPDLRANLALRVCLRVTDPAESQDVLDAPDAARISPRTPGRAWLRRGGGPLEPVQVARTRAAGASAPVRLARPWCGPGEATAGAHGRGHLDLSPGEDEAVDRDARAWVEAARAAAIGRRVPTSPWLPELPDSVTPGQARAADPRAAADPRGGRLTVALGDVPHEQRRAHVTWDATHGHLLILGGPRSGRTSTLVSLGRQAAAQGWTVHAVGLPADAVAELARTGCLGTDVGTDDPRRIARLLELLPARTGAGPRHLILLDGLEAALTALEPVARGAAGDRLASLWAEGPRAVTVAATAQVTARTAGLAASFGDRLVLPVTDAALDVVAGVPPALRGARRSPGRAVHLGPAGALLCQVALEPSTPPATPDPRTRATPRLAPLPSHAVLPAFLPRRADDPRPPTTVVLGPGGDDAADLLLDVGRGLLVVGPPGSGRTTSLVTVVTQLRRAGVEVVQVGTAGRTSAGVTHAASVAEIVSGAGLGRAGTTTVVVDDLDELELMDPLEAERLEQAVLAGAVRLIASAQTERAVGAFRGPVALAARTSTLLVLEPATAGSSDLLGPRAPWVTDPRGGAGRGAVRIGHRVEPVQVFMSA